MTVAMNKYVITLGRIKAALKDPYIADIGEIFKAVLLLAAFEVTRSLQLKVANTNEV